MASVTLNPYSAPELNATCQKCRARYRVSSAMNGKGARCSKCQSDVKISGDYGILPTTSVYDNSVRERKVESAISAKRSTGLGLLMTAWGSVAVFAVISLIMSLSMTAPFVIEQFMLYLGGCLVASGLVVFVGMLVCGSVPRESGAKNWVIVTLVLCSLNLAIGGYVQICNLVQVAPAVSPTVLNLASTLIGTICFFTFLTFIRKTAEYVRRPEMATMAKVIMWIQLAILIPLFGIVVVSLAFTIGNSLAAIINTIVILILITTLINQIVLAVLEFQLGTHLRQS